MNLVTNGVPYVVLPWYPNHRTLLGKASEISVYFSDSWGSSFQKDHFSLESSFRDRRTAAAPGFDTRPCIADIVFAFSFPSILEFFSD